MFDLFVGQDHRKFYNLVTFPADVNVFQIMKEEQCM